MAPNEATGVDAGESVQPAEDEMPVEAASVYAAVLGVDDPASVPGREVDGRLAPLLGLRALVGREEGEGRAGGHGVLAARVLLPQVLSDDAVQRRRRRQVPVELLLHGRALAKGAVVRLLPQHAGLLAAGAPATHLPVAGEDNAADVAAARRR